MATYANSTNPFIKVPNASVSGGFGQINNIEVIGAATTTTPLYHHTDEDLLMSSGTIETLSLQNAASEHTGGKMSIKSEEDAGASKIEVSGEVVGNRSDVISEVCRALVNATLEAELEKPVYGVSCNSGDQNPRSTKGSEHQADHHGENEAELDAELDDEVPMEKGSRNNQHIELIKKLRLQLQDLEKYAYERGELDQIPPSVVAEKQTVILDTLKERLSLSFGLDKLAKLELNQIKNQVDKEINDLIDPLITKEHLLNQLRTQLTDLERYIAHLHSTLGKSSDNRCPCHLHGCSVIDDPKLTSSFQERSTNCANINGDETLPKTTRLIRNIVAQLICSDMKLQECARKEKEFVIGKDKEPINEGKVVTRQVRDDPAWALYMDKVILATDSLINLYTLDQKHRNNGRATDDNLVESVVRRQLVPAIRDLLSYGLMDTNKSNRPGSYGSLSFDPYYLLASLTCFPSSVKSNIPDERESLAEKPHAWYVAEEYYRTRKESSFESSSMKSLSLSFNLAPSISGPIKITSKQALLIAIDGIIETLASCKPNGPESHFRAFVYTALNQSKLATWLRLIFKNKSIVRKHYHDFSFVTQPDKMDKFLKKLEDLNQFEFKLRTDSKSIEQFISAF